MPINIDRALGIHAQALILRSRRAEVLAANLANADTPNYKARDIDFKAALTAAQNQLVTHTARAETTHPAHIALAAPAQSIPDVELVYREPQQSNVDGNTVDAQKEHSEFMQNALQYQASLTFLSGRIRSLLTAIRGE